MRGISYGVTGFAIVLGASINVTGTYAQAIDRLSSDLEIEVALSALPPHLRDEATVYLLERDGYVEAKSGTNGFSCIVRASGVIPGRFSDSVIPICYDAEGSRTLLRAVFDETTWLAQGQGPDQVGKAVAAKWERGEYTVPQTGISYMLSSIFYLNGSFGTFPPHLMFYAPYKEGVDIGANEDPLDHVPFIQAPGLPSAMIVVPTGQVERAAIAAEQKSLMEVVRSRLAPGSPASSPRR